MNISENAKKDVNCARCGTTTLNMWRIRNNEVICNDCYKLQVRTCPHDAIYYGEPTRILSRELNTLADQILDELGIDSEDDLYERKERYLAERIQQAIDLELEKAKLEFRADLSKDAAFVAIERSRDGAYDEGIDAAANQVFNTDLLPDRPFTRERLAIRIRSLKKG